MHRAIIESHNKKSKEMNIEEIMREAIKDKIITGYENNSTDISSAAKAVLEIAERNAIEFAEWLGKNAYHNDEYWYAISAQNEEITIDELYQLFLNSKEKDNDKY